VQLHSGIFLNPLLTEMRLSVEDFMLRRLIILAVLASCAPLFALSPVPDNRIVTAPNGQYRLHLNRHGVQSVYRVGESVPLWTFEAFDPGRQYFLSTDGWVVAEFGRDVGALGTSGEPWLVLRTRGCESRLDAGALALKGNLDGWVRCTQQGNVLQIAAENGARCKVSLGDCRVVEAQPGGTLFRCCLPCEPEPEPDWLPMATCALLLLGAIYDIRRRIKER
jgi:hypothetical protein